MKLEKHHKSALAALAAAALLGTFATIEFLKMHQPDEIRPSEGLTRTGMLSDYFDWLKGTNGDTPVYYYEGEEPGATVLILGGTHPNEPSGAMAAFVIAENLSVRQGRVIVIPQACMSGYYHTHPLEGQPQFFTVEGRNGPRRFRLGSRAGSSLDQWPDPMVYLHHPSGQRLSGSETRNLNRAYPGRPDGTFTERVAHAIVELIKREQVTVAFDLHEAAPEIPIINAIVVHEKNQDIGAGALLNLEMEGLQYALEISPRNFRGLSHREWGDATDAYAFLMETCNPIQGRLRGVTDEELVVEGVDKNYKTALELGRMRITYDPEGEPLDRRAARHIEAIHQVLNTYNELHPELPVVYEGFPTYVDLTEKGFKEFLN